MPGRIIHFQQIAHGWRLGSGYVEQLLSFDPHQSRAGDIRVPDPANKVGIPVIVGKDGQRCSRQQSPFVPDRPFFSIMFSGVSKTTN